MKIIEFGLEAYQPIWDRMKTFTTTRRPDTPDELWLLEHYPVYTLGQAGKREHIIDAKNIPIIQSDRGGQVTYHGPGQLIAYVLLDLRRRHIGIKNLVHLLEQVLINMLHSYQIDAHRRHQAPGVYVAEKKIASIGLRVKAGCTYHGIALNVAGDLAPFTGIHPCGYQALQMTAIQDYYPNIMLPQARHEFVQHYMQVL